MGALIGAAELIEMGRRVIPPYCLAQPTIEAALAALAPEALIAARARIAHLLAEREYVRAGLAASPLVAKIWPSDANFLMVESPDADAFMRASMQGGLIVRDLRANPALPRSLRVTIGTRAENDRLLGSLARP